MAPRGPPLLLGRAEERQLLDRLLLDVREGQSGVVVVRGEAGVGKTALLQQCAEHASGFRIAQIAGVEAEMELPFAGVHQLCAPMFGWLEGLPEPQRDALSVALGLSLGEVPDRFLVALAALSLLSAAAEERPLLCLVDDAQWLDGASGQVLGFVARRLHAESVAIVLAIRDPAGNEPATMHEFEGLPELALAGLDEDDARALLARVIPGRLDGGFRDRVLAETRGNPLALLELPQGMSAADLAGGFELPAGDVPGHIEAHYLRRVGALPEPTQRLMLLAAADPVGDASLVWRAAETLGIQTGARAAAEDADLLEIGARVRFRHPLVRSAAYRSAAASDRRAIHLALAEATDRELDPDRRAWHLASAAAGPDEEVATELERSAGRARARGGLAAAAAFLQRAVALTSDPERRTDRALAAADLGVRAGAFDAARVMMAVADVGPLDELQRARLDMLRAEAAYSESRGSAAPALLLRAAKTLEPLDPELARETYLDAWSSALFAGKLATSVGLEEVSREARAARAAADRARPSDALLDGFSLAFTQGRSAAAPVLEEAATGYAGKEVSVEEGLRWGWLATAAAVMVWDYETCLAVAMRGVQLAREAGALTVLSVSVNVLAQALALGGEFGRAALLVAEADNVTEATGTRVAPYGALVLAGLRGREDQASRLIESTIEEFTAGGQGTAVQYARWSHSVLLNGLGRYREAMVAADEASDDTPELFVSVWAASELVEAASRCDDVELARDALNRVAAAAAVAPTDWGLGIAARCQALLSEGETAEGLYKEAIKRLGRTRLRPELARAHLLYGEWLRRENRRADARAQLRTAHEQFIGIGMEAFGERARAELLATGASVRKRTVETRDELTAQEWQIARLARDGLSNPEIGARLFLSPRTVEWHLRKVFSKLGIHSRRELASALPNSDPQLTSV
jgi:DNA-binding CsgD family transcriptional regulator